MSFIVFGSYAPGPDMPPFLQLGDTFFGLCRLETLWESLRSLLAGSWAFIKDSVCLLRTMRVYTPTHLSVGIGSSALSGMTLRCGFAFGRRGFCCAFCKDVVALPCSCSRECVCVWHASAWHLYPVLLDDVWRCRVPGSGSVCACNKHQCDTNAFQDVIGATWPGAISILWVVFSYWLSPFIIESRQGLVRKGLSIGVDPVKFWSHCMHSMHLF